MAKDKCTTLPITVHVIYFSRHGIICDKSWTLPGRCVKHILLYFYNNLLDQQIKQTIYHMCCRIFQQPRDRRPQQGRREEPIRMCARLSIIHHVLCHRLWCKNQVEFLNLNNPCYYILIINSKMRIDFGIIGFITWLHDNYRIKVQNLLYMYKRMCDTHLFS